LRMGFLVNPVSGTGGLAGLKGTDGLFFKAVRKGGIPLSYRKAYLFLKGLSPLLCNNNKSLEVITPPSYMGYSLVKPFFYKCSNVRIELTRTFKLDLFPSTRYHTIQAVREMISGNVDLDVYHGTIDDFNAMIHPAAVSQISKGELHIREIFSSTK